MRRIPRIFKHSEHARRFLWGLIFLAFFSWLIGPFLNDASAANISAGFTCVGGTVSANANLFTSGGDNDPNSTLGQATGGADVTSNTGGAATMGGGCGKGGFFSRVMCVFKTAIGQIMASMYCGMQNALKGPLTAALTLLVTVFGILMVTGMTQFNVKEASALFFKIALVWTFATNADFGIGIAYKFFMAVAEGGTNIVVAAIAPAGKTLSITEPETYLGQVFNFTSGAGVSTGSITTITTYCASLIAIMCLMMFLFMPTVILFVLFLIFQYIALYARAMLGYVTALVLISFLFVLSPLFLSFALFKTTMKLFEKWIAYLTTYSIQMVIVFAFLTMLQLVPVIDFMIELSKLVREYDTTWSKWFLGLPVHMCSFCDYSIAPPGPVISGACPVGGGGDGYYPGTCIPGSTVSCMAAVGTPPEGDVVGVPNPDGTPTNFVIPVVSLLKRHDLILFVVVQVIVLSLICKVMEDFLKKAPDLAKQIGGVPGALALGHVGGPPTGGPAMGYIGLDSIQAAYHGFKNGMTARAQDAEGNPVRLTWGRRLSGGMSQGFGAFLHGAQDTTSSAAHAREAKIKRAQLRYGAMEAQYKSAQNKTKQAHDAMETALKEVDDLKKHGRDPAMLAAAIKSLKQSHENYALATKGEPDRKKRLLEEKAALELLMMQRTQLRGILGSKDSKGNVIHQGSILEGMFAHSSGDEASREISRLRGEAQEKDMYGHALAKGEMMGDGMYYFMKMPEGVSAGQELVGMHDLQKQAESMVSSLEIQLRGAAHYMSPDQLREFESALGSAKSNLNATKTTQGMQSVIDELAKVQQKLG